MKKEQEDVNIAENLEKRIISKEINCLKEFEKKIKLIGEYPTKLQPVYHWYYKKQEIEL